MYSRPGSSGTLTARLDSLKYELRAEMHQGFGTVRAELGELKGDIRELKGMIRGFTVALSVGVPVLSGLLIFGVNLASHKLGW